jgi:uncharacterized protein YjlB
MLHSHDQTIQTAHVICHTFDDDGTFPNNSKLPVIIYKGAFLLHPDEDAPAINEVFEKNNWKNSWEAGIFDYHHYHSITHEVLGVVCGTADIQLGGPEGVCVEVVRGDVVLIPAGVAHKCLKASGDFSVVGAYPNGKDYDLNKGQPGDRPKADENILRVELPDNDPVYGTIGPLKEHWS